MDNLDTLRESIDSIDKAIVELLEKRMEVVLKVAEYKKKNSLPILNKAREQEVIRKNVARLKNKRFSRAAEEIFENIMNVSKKLEGGDGFDLEEQHKNSILGKFKYEFVEHIKGENKNAHFTVGFQGIPGSFSQEALLDFFGEDVNSNNYDEFEDVFIAIKEDKIKYGILPIENSSTGGISEVYDLLRKYGFYIVGEKCVKVCHNLLGVEGATLEDIEEVYSHPQAFEQSSVFLKKYSKWKLVPYYNTATSAKLVAEKRNKAFASISSEEAAELYNLKIIKNNINYNQNNYTRFIVIAKELEVMSTSNKISILISVPHKVGSLYRILSDFSENNINMIKIQSRPITDSPFEYFFYIDFEGNVKEKFVHDSINVIEKKCSDFRFLGNYKADASVVKHLQKIIRWNRYE